METEREDEKTVAILCELCPLSVLISCPLWRLVVSAAVAGTVAETWTADCGLSA